MIQPTPSKSIVRFPLTAAAIFTIGIGNSAAADSLYKRLGGYDAIAEFVATALTTARTATTTA